MYNYGCIIIIIDLFYSICNTMHAPYKIYSSLKFLVYASLLLFDGTHTILSVLIKSFELISTEIDNSRDKLFTTTEFQQLVINR